MENVESRRTPIQLGTERFHPTYTSSDFLNPVALAREEKDIVESLRDDSAILDSQILTVTKDLKTLKRWVALSHKEVFEAESSLHTKISQHPEGESLNADFLFRIIDAARCASLNNIIERRRQLAEKSDFSYFYNPVGDLEQFYMAGQYSVKVDGISMKDLMDDPKISPSSYYRYAAESKLVRVNMSHITVLEENLSPLSTRYPNVAKSNIEEASGHLMALASTTPERFEQTVSHFLPHRTNAENRLIAIAKNMVKRTHSLSQEVFATLFNPTSSEFAALRNTIGEYLSKDTATKTMSLLLLGLGDPDKVSAAYRTARELAQENDGNSLFYQNLSNIIREFVEELPSGLHVLTKDDLASLLDTSYVSNSSSIPTFEDIKKFTGELTQKYSTNVYSVETNNINLGPLIPPKLIRFKFYEGGTRKFIFLLNYQNDAGESINFNVWFDTSRDIFDWDFMEAPDDPEMKDIKDAILVVTKSILIDIQKQTESEYQQKQAERQSKAQAPQVRTRKSQPKEPYVPREKVAGQKSIIPRLPIQETQVTQLTFPVKETVRRYVSQPEEDIRSMLAGISQANQNLIIEGVTRFNERGAGKFKHLADMIYQGKPVYELRTGRFRALAIRTDPTDDDVTNRKDPFIIYKIDNRNDIFRN